MRSRCSGLCQGGPWGSGERDNRFLAAQGRASALAPCLLFQNSVYLLHRAIQTVTKSGSTGSVVQSGSFTIVVAGAY